MPRRDSAPKPGRPAAIAPTRGRSASRRTTETPTQAPSSRQAAKRAKRERSRMRREELQRRMARRRRVRRFALLAAVPIVVLGLAVWLLVSGRHHSPKAPPQYAAGATVDFGKLHGVLEGAQPWGSNVGDLTQRLQSLGLPTMATEGTAEHIHQHLDIYVGGRQVTVPADIGISADNGYLSPIHTHTADGVIHVEADTRGTFTLGQLFGVWGVRLSPTCVGGYCNGDGKTLRVFVDGFPATKDPRQLILFAHEEIVIAFGTPAQLPDPIPSSYTFGYGL